MRTPVAAPAEEPLRQLLLLLLAYLLRWRRADLELYEELRRMLGNPPEMLR